MDEVFTYITDPCDPLDKPVETCLCYKDADGYDETPDTEDDWQCLPPEYGTGTVTFSKIDDDEDYFHVEASGLTADYWYYFELIDKGECCDEWTVLGDDLYGRFYGQADGDGDLEIEFTWEIDDHEYIEVNVKNADWVAKLDPSDYGNEDDDWIYTGQGWDYVLYACSTVPLGCGC
jgi:hypothetical protein